MTNIAERIADLVELNLRSGDPTPEVDTIAIDLKRTEGIGLSAAVTLIEDRMAAVLAVLETRGRVGTRVTAHYLANYKDETPDHPIQPREIAGCVAGLGRGNKTVALHFCAEGNNCVLSIGRAVHALDSGKGAIRSETERIQIEAKGGVLDAEGIAPDWNEQAAKAAQAYLDYTAFSHQGLIDQLLYEGYTAEQAAYGVAAVGY